MNAQQDLEREINRYWDGIQADIKSQQTSIDNLPYATPEAKARLKGEYRRKMEGIARKIIKEMREKKN